MTKLVHNEAVTGILKLGGILIMLAAAHVFL